MAGLCGSVDLSLNRSIALKESSFWSVGPCKCGDKGKPELPFLVLEEFWILSSDLSSQLCGLVCSHHAQLCFWHVSVCNGRLC